MNALHPIEVFFSSHHPLASKVNANFTGSLAGTVLVCIEASPELVLDEEAQTLHTGFATIVLDSIMGGAVMGSLDKLMPIATVGLSINHLRRPASGEKLNGKAVCTAIHNDLAYVTGELNGADGKPVAIASGTFMLGTRGTSIRSKTDCSDIIGKSDENSGASRI